MRDSSSYHFIIPYSHIMHTSYECRPLVDMCCSVHWTSDVRAEWQIPGRSRFLLSHNRHRTWWLWPGCHNNPGHCTLHHWWWARGLPGGRWLECLQEIKRREGGCLCETETFLKVSRVLKGIFMLFQTNVYCWLHVMLELSYLNRLYNPKWKLCHHLLTLTSFQICMTFFLW